MNSGIEYLNLTDASEAEKEILRSMLFEGVADEPTGNNLFQFLKPTPPGFSSVDSEIGSESSEVSELCPVSVQSTNPGSDLCQENQNGQTLRVTPQNVHLMDHGDGEIHNGNGPSMLISQGPPPQHMRNFYPSGHVMAGPPPHIHGGHTPSHQMGHAPMSVYQSHMTHPQMLQAPGGAYFSHASMQQQQYQPILHYGYPPPPYIQADNDHSHNHVHLQKHLDPITHHSSTTGPYKNHNNRNKNQRSRRSEDQNINHNPYQPYYPNVGYGAIYYNPGIAQTVTNMTGPPLIMPSTGVQPQPTLYSPYPSPNQTHVYTGSAGVESELPSQSSGPETVIPVELSVITQPFVSPKTSTKHEMKDLYKNIAVLDPLKANNIASSQATPTLPETFEHAISENEAEVSAEASLPLDTAELTKEGATSAQIIGDTITSEQTLVRLENVEDLRDDEQTTNRVELEQPVRSKNVVANVAKKQLSQDSETYKASIKSTNGPSSWVNAAVSHQRISPPAVPSLTTKGDAHDFPELGQPCAVSPTLPKSTASCKERSWASIASSKTGNNPTNGIIQVVPDNVAQTTAVGIDENCDGYLKNVQSTNSRSFVAPMTDLTQTQDKSSYTDENDPIALQLGEFLSNYNLDHHSLSLTPRGLSNQSNFCYINATLQSLIACPPFVNLFRSMKDIIGKWPCKATPIIQSVFNFVMEFEPITRISQGRHKRPNDAFNVGSTFEAAGIRRVLGLFDGATFKVEGRQEDAEEFLSHLLNGLHDEMIKVIKWADNKKSRPNSQNSNNQVGRPITPATNGDSFEMKEEDDDQWQVMGPKNKGCMTRKTCLSKSPISEMFVGQMCSALNRTIGFKSTTLQPFFTLQLDIQEDNIHSVRDALEGLSTKEEVTGFMSGSGQETGAWKQLSLEILPIIMILHMKRFVYDKSGNKIHKLDKKVDFPVDLEIGRELLSVNSKGKYTPKQRQYKLFAAVYHDGEEAHKGHYIADCFHPSGGSLWGQFGWIRYDDTAVKSIAEPLILNPQPPRVPYLLYYRRVDTLSQTKKDRL